MLLLIDQVRDSLLELLLDFIYKPADRRALLAWHIRHAPHYLGQLAGAPQHSHPNRLNLLLAGAVRQFLQRASADLIQLFLHLTLLNAISRYLTQLGNGRAEAGPVRPPLGCY